MSEHAELHPEGEGHAESGHGEGHGTRHYLVIWGVLVVLLIVSVVGPTLEIRAVTLLTAFGVAVVKAYLVCKHFMHLDLQPKFVLYFLGAALIFMGIFVAGVAPDVLEHTGANWRNVAAEEEIARAMATSTGGEGEAAAFDAAATFRSTCGPCHGEGGRGDGPAAASLDPHPANFTDATFWETRDHDHIVQTITQGGAAVGRSPLMPPFGTQFSAEQIEQIAQHVESLRPE